MSLSDADVWHAIADGYTATAMHLLQPFSRAALDGVPLGPDSRVLDVACGPGTLTELVAPHVAHVLAVDFAPAMVRACRDRLASQTQVEVREGDGQNLGLQPTFDAAFSMFGLMFFPDRAAGLRSMRGAVRPGGHVVVSSWVPVDRSPAMTHGLAMLKAAFPFLPDAPVTSAFASVDEVRAELEASGLRDVSAREVRVPVQRTAEEAWRDMAIGAAPVHRLRQSLSPEAWAEGEARAVAWLAAHHPTDPLDYVAIIGQGRV